MADPPTSRRQFLGSTAWAVPTLAVTSHAVQQGSGAERNPGGWTRLFDGKTLTGWHKNPRKIQHGTGGRWLAEGGTLSGEQDPPGSGNGGILLTNRKFGDFELSLDVNPDWGVDTGLLLRCNDRGQCFQVMIDYHDRGNVGQLTSITGKGPLDFNTRTFDINGRYGTGRKLLGLTTDRPKSAQSVGLEYSCTPQEWIKTWKRNDWNTLRVCVEGQYPRIATWLNDVQVCVFDGRTSSNKLYLKEELFETLGRAGSIALQTYHGPYCPRGSKSRWKNIKIREMGR